MQQVIYGIDIPDTSHLPVMPETLEITVTEADIRDGRKCSTARCPIALAVLRKAAELNLGINPTDYDPRHGYLSVGPYTVYLGQYIDRDHMGSVVMRMTAYELPAEAKQFIENFDDDYLTKSLLCEPFTFKMTQAHQQVEYR